MVHSHPPRSDKPTHTRIYCTRHSPKPQPVAPAASGPEGTRTTQPPPAPVARPQPCTAHTQCYHVEAVASAACRLRRVLGHGLAKRQRAACEPKCCSGAIFEAASYPARYAGLRGDGVAICCCRAGRRLPALRRSLDGVQGTLRLQKTRNRHGREQLGVSRAATKNMLKVRGSCKGIKGVAPREHVPDKHAGRNCNDSERDAQEEFERRI